MSRGRAFRRSQTQRKKTWAAKTFYWIRGFGLRARTGYSGREPEDFCWTEADPRLVGILSKTPHPCSCYCCANKRKYEGPTPQEKRCLF